MSGRGSTKYNAGGPRKGSRKGSKSKNYTNKDMESNFVGNYCVLFGGYVIVTLHVKGNELYQAFLGRVKYHLLDSSTLQKLLGCTVVEPLRNDDGSDTPKPPNPKQRTPWNFLGFLFDVTNLKLSDYINVGALNLTPEQLESVVPNAVAKALCEYFCRKLRLVMRRDNFGARKIYECGRNLFPVQDVDETFTLAMRSQALCKLSKFVTSDGIEDYIRRTFPQHTDEYLMEHVVSTYCEDPSEVAYLFESGDLTAAMQAHRRGNDDDDDDSSDEE
mmetsp:Transcript_22295/g.33193  ORF Transcript_22295/g.33193 Transcript_22295/m.33193 type:complete len:274 (-) Transcript_22295:224-1045(-)|eukprot:CAMPEP_0194046564 /NCGR_PEP_ID=MMETSP0009_2-20130614/21644_1 /TAXON_ID=210454 /ORGANISM="Grammatophora oceanica, Strain CCMP 410" /LENGTH=273 /DNA_ID=CAMNT_0038691911 /DNA_START=512 /DNA_END=1333 /DNA_ORIENTATION=+